MARFSFRRYDVQATWSMILSLCSIPPVALAAYQALKRYNREMGTIEYGSGSLLVEGMMAALAFSAFLSALGLVLGGNSAGQRRNDKPARSWFGFFVGGLVLSATILVGLAFMMLRLPVA